MQLGHNYYSCAVNDLYLSTQEASYALEHKAYKVMHMQHGHGRWAWLQWSTVIHYL